MKKSLLSVLLVYPWLVVAEPLIKWQANINNNCSYAVLLTPQNTYQWSSGGLASDQPISPYSSIIAVSYPVSSGNMLDDSINWMITGQGHQPIIANFLFSYTSSVADFAAFPNYVLGNYTNPLGITEYTLFAGATGNAQITAVFANNDTQTVYVTLTVCPANATVEQTDD